MTWTLVVANSPISVRYLGGLEMLRVVILLLTAIVGVAAVVTLFIPH